MNPGTEIGLLQLISNAVTPVVMVSACATLILGINTKHSGVADRLRDAAREYRSTEANARREQLTSQIVIFYRRFLITRIALFALYAAVVSFISSVLFIIVSTKHLLSLDSGALGAFVVGVVLMLSATSLEFAELKLSSSSILIEISDVTSAEDRRRGRLGRRRKMSSGE